MKHLLLFLALFANAISLKSQTPNFEWALQIGDTLTDYTNQIATDNSGNVYTFGIFSGTVDFDAGAGVFQLTSVGSDDIFIQKNGAAGNFIWAKKIGGTTSEEALSFTLDVNNNIIATGEFRGTVDFDPGPGITNLTSYGVGDIFVLKLNSNGDFIWVKQMGSAGNEYGTSVTTSSDGSIYSAGIFNTITDFDPNAGISNLVPVGTLHDAYIQKLDINGNFLWVKQLSGTSYTQVFSMVADNNDDLCLTGTFNGTSDFDPGSGVVSFISGTYDAFVLKLDNSGNYIWAKKFGGTSGDFGYSINADTIGNLYLTGYFANTVDFDPGALSYNLTSNGSTDAYILKLNELGNFQWVKQIGGVGFDVGYSIVVTNNGLVFSIGRYSNTVDFDSGSGVLNHVSNGSTDVYIQELDTNGNFIWAGVIGGTSTDYGVSLSLGNNGSIYATGFFVGLVDFNPNAGVSNLNSYSPGFDGFILKLSTCGVITGTDVVTACAPYTWIDNITYTSSTTIPTFTLVNGSVSGCDSIVSLNLTINSVDNSVVNSSNSITANAIGASYQWLDCNNSNAIIPGESNQVFVALTNGNYAVQVTQNGCIDTSTCILISTVEIKETNGNNISVYPNPTKDNITIETGTNSKMLNYALSTVEGKIICESHLQQNRVTINLQNLDIGIYFLKVTKDDKVNFFKIVKE